MAAIHFQLEMTLKDKKETLRWSLAEFSSRLKFSGVLGKSRAHGRARVNNGHAGFHARQRGAHESVRRQ